jgi:DNA polymerase III subunit delta'
MWLDREGRPMRDERELPWLAEPLRALRDDSRSHALIVHGGVGSGLFELALRVAQAWLCEQPPGPCDVCPSCHLATAHTHPDLRVLLPEALQASLNWGSGDGEGGEGGDGEGKSKKKPSKEIKVDAIRQAIDWAHGSSSRGRGKVLVVYPADAMNAVSANALLKTLEEPAAGMRLLLCVDDPEHLLPTIRSRCQRVRLAPPPEAEALEWLTRQGVADAAVLLRAANGEPLAALATAANGLTGEAWAALPRQVAQGDGRLLLSLTVPDAVRVLQQLCHDAMAVAAGASPRFFPTQALPAQHADWPALADWSRELARIARQQDHPWHAGLLLDALLAQGRQALSPNPSPRGGTAAPARERAQRVGTLRP